MKEWMMVGGVLLFSVLLGVIIFNSGKPRYRRKAALTGGDLEFFNTLRCALPDCHIFPRMAMTALLDPAGMGRKRKSALQRIVDKQVGYAVFDEEMQLCAVVELSHRSGVSRRELARDEFFASAGIKTFRFQARKLPSAAKIGRAILAHAPRESLLSNAVHAWQ